MRKRGDRGKRESGERVRVWALWSGGVEGSPRKKAACKVVGNGQQRLYTTRGDGGEEPRREEPREGRRRK
ncbi:hypothetical protein Nepgr_033213 [Nepenthes gracilis]|uniref:Uncharacterized protein n=1 Tax=Nepenthes gracilis TaxID=150966 RepID=A0AAD3TK41_NEPGR|nr:hypothetical protein Nepgr_033213 [Nepenthes gracilis]